jgi:hypothetical protein
MICNPDGSITVNQVLVDGVADANHANFDFTWYVGATTNAPVINAVNDADVLDINNLPTIGAGSYFVKAKRVSGVTIGSGCESAPLRVEIEDLSVDPDVTITQTSPNTSCNPALLSATAPRTTIHLRGHLTGILLHFRPHNRTLLRQVN